VRLRDFAILILVIGIASTVFVNMISDTELEDHYGTISSHGEDGFSTVGDALIANAETQEDVATNMQDDILSEDEVSIYGVGAATFNVLKNSLNFDYLNSSREVISLIEEELNIPPAIISFAFAILLLIIVFTIVGAFLRWRA